ncbi:MAG TPA: flagellin [Syntrophus sp. (in: bacteria)]|nr:flagellin [Syntrophus sp. (in: bacteria)]
MGFRIQNNIAAMNAQRNLAISDAGMSKSLERLSSGYRINSAKDDAAGLAISQAFRADIASVKVAQRNISEANSLLQTAEGAMSSVGDILTRMKELATQASSANVGADIAKLSTEYNTLVLEIDRIAYSTKYAGTALVNGSFTGGSTVDAANSTIDTAGNIYDINVANAASAAYVVTYSATDGTLTMTSGGVSQTKTIAASTTMNFDKFNISFKTTAAATTANIGAGVAGTQTILDNGTTSKKFQVGYEEDSNSQLNISLGDLNTAALKDTGSGVAANDISTTAGALAKMSDIDDAIDKLASVRGDVGAYQNRLGYAAGNLASTLENFSASESVIRDVDMAAEMTTFTKNQILVQAGTSMLAQANMASQGVLSLFK